MRPPHHRYPPILLLFLALLAPASLALAQTAPAATHPATSPAAPVTLALLSGPSFANAGPSDLMLLELAKSLQSTPTLQLLDRDHIRKLLDEHKLNITALIQQPLQQGAMLGAKYFLYLDQQQNLTSQTRALLCIEVSSGNVIWEKNVTLDSKITPADLEKLTPALVYELASAITANERLHDRPSATVLSVVNKSPSDRLGFLEPSLQGTLEDLLQSQNYRVLRRKNPKLLATETTLGISGLVRPDAAVLAQSADLVLAASFQESPSLNIAFENTPIHLTLTVTRKGQPATETKITFTLATMKTLLPELRKAITAPGQSFPASDPGLPRQLEAARLLAQLKDPEAFPSLSEFILKRERAARNSEFSFRQVDLDAFAHLAAQEDTARRVIYLDPSAADAYYHLGIALDAKLRPATPWKHLGEDPALGRQRQTLDHEAAEAFSQYLAFNPSDVKRAHRAAVYLIFHRGNECADNPAPILDAMSLWVRWQHDHAPEICPQIDRPITKEFRTFWKTQTKKRLAFYLWAEQLYLPSRFSPVLLEIATCCRDLNDQRNLAKYLIECVNLAKPQDRDIDAQWQFGGMPVLNEVRARFQLDSLRPYLDPDQLRRLQSVFTTKPDKPDPTPAMYGNAYAPAPNVWSYACSPYSYRLPSYVCKTAKPTPIHLPIPIKYSVMIHTTHAGLWVQGLNSKIKLSLFLSTKPGSWQEISCPPEMQEVPRDREDEQTHVVAVEQLGNEVLFGTITRGLFIYNATTNAVRHLALKQGLSTLRADNLVLDPHRQCIWITNGGFLASYKDGKIFTSTARLPQIIAAAMLGDKGLMVVPNDRDSLLSVDFISSKITTLLKPDLYCEHLHVPSLFWPRRGRSLTYFYHQHFTTAPSGNRFYVLTPGGLEVLDHTGKILHLWRPDDFYYWNSLAGWSRGNCPLPPCPLTDVVPDDTDPDLLWLVSKYYDAVVRYDFAWTQYPSNIVDRPFRSFVTAFRPSKNTFSKPIEIEGGFVHMAPRGDSLYFTGKTLASLPKKLWPTDQIANPDAPLQIDVPNTPFGLASRDLLLNHPDQAVQHLQSAIDANLAPDEARKIIRDLSSQARPAPAP